MIDVAIAGAGPVGATLALSLAGSDLDVTVVAALGREVDAVARAIMRCTLGGRLSMLRSMG